MGRFELLQQIEGVTKTTKMAEYKGASDELVGRGLCAAMSMRWLSDNTVPTAKEDFQRLSEIQSSYKSSYDPNEPTWSLHNLAQEFGLNVVKYWPSQENEQKSMQYWTGQGTLGTAVVRYATGKLPNLAFSADHLFPCYMEFYLDVPGAGPADANLKGQHDIALKRDGKLGYVAYDPNAGVYKIKDNEALGHFFDALYSCYRRAYNTMRQTTDLDADLKLITIYQVST